MSISKFQLRKTYRELRAKISAKYRNDAAQRAAELIKSAGFFLQSESIAIYLAVKDEFLTSPIIEAIWQAKKNCYLPILSQDELSLHFVAYRYGDKLRPNRFAILEPVNTRERIAPEDLNLVFIPLIAFDSAGHRVGTGGGYYDRTFHFLCRSSLPIAHPFMAGLAYAAQQVPSIPEDPWDVPLQAIVTEKEIIQVSQLSK